MRLPSRIVLSAAFVAILAGVTRADVKKRWELDFKHDRPEHYSYTSPIEKVANFWYLTFTVTNNTPQAVPYIVDVTLRVDVRNYLEAGFYPIEEHAIIAHADGLEGYNMGTQKEIVEDFKKTRKYLNPSDLRKIPVLQPGEKVHCLAMFPDKGYRYNDVEVLVSGLVDPVTYKYERAEGEFTSSSNIHLRYENRVFRLKYERTGDQFYSFARGLTLVKHDWIVVGVNPAVTKEDIREFTAALTNEDALVRRVALDLLRRHTTDPSLRGLDDAAMAAKFVENKDAILALAEMQGLGQKTGPMFATLLTDLSARIPPIAQELTDLKLDGGELNSDQIKDLAEKLRVVMVKAQENKCPTPGMAIAVLSRPEPSSQNIYDWVCGYEDPSTKILYHGIQQWGAFLTELTANAAKDSNDAAVQLVNSLFESLSADDPVVVAVALSTLKDVWTDQRMIFDATAFDPKKVMKDQDAAVKDGIRRWQEWWSRNRDKSYWNPTTKSFHPINK